MDEQTNSPGVSRPTIFLVEEDDDTRPNLTKSLRKLGYRLLVAADPEDAREWVSGEVYIHADLVLSNLISKTPEEVLSVGRELRQHAKLVEMLLSSLFPFAFLLLPLLTLGWCENRDLDFIN